MIAVIQRVSSARVTVGGETVGKIGHGLLIFLGVVRGDGEKEIKYLCEKIVNLRIFDDDEGRFDRSLLDVNGEALLVSQFTLAGAWRKGRRPGFDNAAPPAVAEPMVDRFRDTLESLGAPTQTGRFGAKMSVSLANEGPVTFVLDTAALP